MTDVRSPEGVAHLHSVTFAADDGSTILSDITFDLAPASLTFLQGPEASGKSSLLKLLFGALQPTRGQVRVLGLDLATASRAARAGVRRRIGIVFQDIQFLPDQPVFDTIALPLRLAGTPEERVRRDVGELLRWIALSDRAQQPVTELSARQCQRVALARAVIARPSLLLADEPLAHADDRQVRHTMSLFEELSRRGAAVLVTTRDPSLAERFSHAQMRLDHGRLRPVPATVMLSSRTPKAPANPVHTSLGQASPRSGRHRKGVMPRFGGAGLSLIAAITGLASLLATLALATAMVTGAAAREWQDGLSNGLTLLVPALPDDGDSARQRALVMARLAAMPDVTRVTALEDRAVRAQLEPWLGADVADLPDLPLPGVIEIDLARPGTLTPDTLRAQLGALADGLTINDHRPSLARVTRTQAGIEWGAGIVVAGVILATLAATALVTRTRLTLHGASLHLLALLGTRDGDLATALARGTFARGLLGGAIGTGLGIVAAVLLIHLAGLPVTLVESTISGTAQLLLVPPAAGLTTFLATWLTARTSLPDRA